MKQPRISPQTLQVLDCFLENSAKWRYGYDLSRETGLKSGTLYPILIRLHKYRLLETKWLTTKEGTPPRHTYRLTADGLQFARAKRGNARLRRLMPRPGLSGDAA